MFLSLFNLACGSDTVLLTIYPGARQTGVSAHSKFLTSGFCKQKQFYAGTVDPITGVLKDSVKVKLNTDFSSIISPPTAEVAITNLLNSPATSFYDEAVRVFVKKGVPVQLAMIGSIAVGGDDGFGDCSDFGDDTWAYTVAVGKTSIQPMNDASVTIPVNLSRKKVSISLDSLSQVTNATELNSDSGRASFILAWVKTRTSDTGPGYASRENISITDPKDIAVSSDGNTIFVASSNGVLISTDGGVHYSVASGTVGLAVNKIQVDGSKVYAATQSGVWYSVDSGSTFSVVPNTAGVSFRSVFVKGSTNTMAAIDSTAVGDRIWYGADYLSPGMTALGTLGLTVSFRDVSIDTNGLVYIATSSGVYVSGSNSPTGMASFTQFSVTGSTLNNNLNCVYLDSVNGVYVGGERGLAYSASYVSGGSSLNLALLPSNLQNQNVRRINKDISSGGLVRVATDAEIGVLSSGILVSISVFLFKAPYFGITTSLETQPRVFALYNAGIIRSEPLQTIKDLKVVLDPTLTQVQGRQISLTPAYSTTSSLPLPEALPTTSTTTRGYAIPNSFPLHFSYKNDLGQTCSLSVTEGGGTPTSTWVSYFQPGRTSVAQLATNPAAWTCL